MVERNYDADAVGELQWIRFLLVLVVVALCVATFLLWKIYDAVS